ncbi:hypothetical protein TWF106_006364 [Orbilia oligospora]|uniref:Uncharacterized protein n=1 Tax=Orbilia oligospora TaxID=2813651 RepID=A0A7C8UXT7_ORBOL|nr:hypothetical protein TWF106_006364 [Orbilia oligospora]
MSLNNSKGKNPSKRESDKQFLADYTPPGGFPIYLDDSLAARIKFGAVLPLHPNSPGRVSQPQPSAIPSPEKPEDDRDVNMSVGSPPTSPTQSPIQYPVQSFDGNEPDRDVETSDWYSSELWTRQKVKEQEIKASKLIVYIWAIRTELKIRIQASILESEAKRAYDEEMGKNKKGSMRGKSKIPRTDDASISKGTHPLSKKGSSRNSIPDDMMPTKGKKGDLNFRLVGPDDFLKTLKMSKATEADYFESFRQLRDDIFHSLRSPGKAYDPLFFIQTKEALQDYDRMDTDIPKVPGYLDSNEECTIQ